MSSLARLSVGLLTFSQIPMLLVLTRLSEAPTWFIVLIAANQAALWVYYLYDVRKNERVPPERKRSWWWTLLLLGVFAEMVYFMKFVQDQEAA